MEPMISVLVLCYNNQKFIYKTLRSVFDQTYPNIEILISDDASDEFKAESLLNWININRTSNIKKVSIFENKHNIGTVACVEDLQKKSSGSYLLNITADDVLHNPHVLETAYQKAEELGSDGEMVFGQTEVWDEGLKQKKRDFVSAETEEFLRTASTEEIFAESSYHVILPACYLYRRTLIDKLGNLSNHYKIVGDWPAHLRATRQGIRPYYIENTPFLKHRDGANRCRNQLQSQKMVLAYQEDILKIYLQEVQPYEERLCEEAQIRAQKYYHDRVRAYYTIHIPEYDKLLQNNQKPVELPSLVAGRTQTIKKRVRRKLKERLKRLLHQCITQKAINRTSWCFAVLFILTIGTSFIQGRVWETAGRALAVLCGMSFLALLAELAGKAFGKALIKKLRKILSHRGY